MIVLSARSSVYPCVCRSIDAIIAQSFYFTVFLLFCIIIKTFFGVPLIVQHSKTYFVRPIYVQWLM